MWQAGKQDWLCGIVWRRGTLYMWHCCPPLSLGMQHAARLGQTPTSAVTRSGRFAGRCSYKARSPSAARKVRMQWHRGVLFGGCPCAWQGWVHLPAAPRWQLGEQFDRLLCGCTDGFGQQCAPSTQPTSCVATTAARPAPPATTAILHRARMPAAPKEVRARPAHLLDSPLTSRQSFSGLCGFH